MIARRFRHWLGVLAGFSSLLAPHLASASVFDGGGVFEGLVYASSIVGLAQGGVRGTILRALYYVLSFLALLAVIVIIVAGIYLIGGFGSDESRERAKKMIIYTIVGLVIVFFARLIVVLVITTLSRAGA